VQVINEDGSECPGNFNCPCTTGAWQARGIMDNVYKPPTAENGDGQFSLSCNIDYGETEYCCGYAGWTPPNSTHGDPEYYDGKSVLGYPVWTPKCDRTRQTCTKEHGSDNRCSIGWKVACPKHSPICVGFDPETPGGEGVPGYSRQIGGWDETDGGVVPRSMGTCVNGEFLSEWILKPWRWIRDDMTCKNAFHLDWIKFDKDMKKFADSPAHCAKQCWFTKFFNYAPANTEINCNCLNRGAVRGHTDQPCQEIGREGWTLYGRAGANVRQITMQGLPATVPPISLFA